MQSHECSCLPPFPVLCPDANRCCTADLCYACCVQMRSAAQIGPSAPLPCYHHVEKRQGKVEVQGRTTRPLQALLLLGCQRASNGGIVTVKLSFLLSTLLLDMKHDAANHFMEDIIVGCYCAQRLVLLHHTMHDDRPLFSGTPYFGCFALDGVCPPSQEGWYHGFHREPASLVP